MTWVLVQRDAGRVTWLLVSAAAICMTTVSCGSSARPIASLEVKPCTVEHLAARCGTLIVPEDRLTGQGRAFPVQFVVIPATGPHRAPDPVVYFAGGPGGSAVAEIPASCRIC